MPSTAGVPICACVCTAQSTHGPLPRCGRCGATAPHLEDGIKGGAGESLEAETKNCIQHHVIALAERRFQKLLYAHKGQAQRAALRDEAAIQRLVRGLGVADLPSAAWGLVGLA